MQIAWDRTIITSHSRFEIQEAFVLKDFAAKELQNQFCILFIRYSIDDPEWIIVKDNNNTYRYTLFTNILQAQQSQLSYTTYYCKIIIHEDVPRISDRNCVSSGSIAVNLAVHNFGHHQGVFWSIWWCWLSPLIWAAAAAAPSSTCIWWGWLGDRAIVWVWVTKAACDTSDCRVTGSTDTSPTWMLRYLPTSHLYLRMSPTWTYLKKLVLFNEILSHTTIS